MSGSCHICKVIFFIFLATLEEIQDYEPLSYNGYIFLDYHIFFFILKNTIFMILFLLVQKINEESELSHTQCVEIKIS